MYVKTTKKFLILIFTEKRQKENTFNTLIRYWSSRAYAHGTRGLYRFAHGPNLLCARPNLLFTRHRYYLSYVISQVFRCKAQLLWTIFEVVMDTLLAHCKMLKELRTRTNRFHELLRILRGHGNWRILVRTQSIRFGRLTSFRFGRLHLTSFFYLGIYFRIKSR